MRQVGGSSGVPVDVDEMEAIAAAVQGAHGSVWLVSATGEVGEYRVWRVGRLPSVQPINEEQAVEEGDE